MITDYQNPSVTNSIISFPADWVGADQGRNPNAIKPTIQMLAGNNSNVIRLTAGSTERIVLNRVAGQVGSEMPGT